MPVVPCNGVLISGTDFHARESVERRIAREATKRQIVELAFVNAGGLSACGSADSCESAAPHDATILAAAARCQRCNDPFRRQTALVWTVPDIFFANRVME